jgi:hypothetical protein
MENRSVFPVRVPTRGKYHPCGGLKVEYRYAKFQGKTVDLPRHRLAAAQRRCLRLTITLPLASARCWSEYRAISGFAEAAADAQLVLEMLRAAKTRLAVGAPT